MPRYQRQHTQRVPSDSAFAVGMHAPKEKRPALCPNVATVSGDDIGRFFRSANLVRFFYEVRLQTFFSTQDFFKKMYSR